MALLLTKKMFLMMTIHHLPLISLPFAWIRLISLFLLGIAANGILPRRDVNRATYTPTSMGSLSVTPVVSMEEGGVGESSPPSPSQTPNE
mmetsp:Transcript_22810/g.63429  ORF Transcript_22810/g.63429 Transcript_22810/m.63429 type:complete len:90 (-) Transcript_22810:178-447(-)